jgi:hypothetical protein
MENLAFQNGSATTFPLIQQFEGNSRLSACDERFSIEYNPLIGQSVEAEN